MLHIVIQIILEFVWSGRKIALGEVVDIHEVVASEKVGQLLVVLSSVDAGIQAAGHGNVVLRAILERACEVEIALVHVALLLDVFRTVLAAGIGLDAVDMIEAVPVDMREFGIHVRMGPDFIRPSPFHAVVAVHVGIVVVEVAGQVAVVVRTGVLGVVPVEGGVAVLAETVEGGRTRIELVGRSVVVLHDGDGLFGLADACIANLAVLVAPVGVVHVVTHKVVDFLGGCVLRTALTGSGEEHESEFVRIVEYLVGRCIVCEGTVVDTVDPVVSAETGTHVECEGPAVVHKAGRV